MSAAPEQVFARDGVVIAVDPHKASWTAVVVAPDLTRGGCNQIRLAGLTVILCDSWTRPGPTPGGRSKAVGWGGPSAERLREDQIAVMDVLANVVRLLSTGHGRKRDRADAPSVGIAVWSAPELRTLQMDKAIAALRAVSEHCDDMVRARSLRTAYRASPVGPSHRRVHADP